MKLQGQVMWYNAERQVKVEKSELTAELTNQGFIMYTASTIKLEQGCQGRTSLYYLWLVRLKLFPFLHQLSSVVEDPSVCGYSAWLWNIFYPPIFFYFNAEWALLWSENFAIHGLGYKIPLSTVSISVCACVRIIESRLPSIWQFKGKLIQQHCMRFHQWLCCLQCLTFTQCSQ